MKIVDRNSDRSLFVSDGCANRVLSTPTSGRTVCCNGCRHSTELSDEPIEHVVSGFQDSCIPSYTADTQIFFYHAFDVGACAGFFSTGSTDTRNILLSKNMTNAVITVHCTGTWCSTVNTKQYVLYTNNSMFFMHLSVYNQFSHLCMYMYVQF